MQRAHSTHREEDRTEASEDPIPDSEGITSDEWLRGYFTASNVDVAGGAPPARPAKWKNFDFLRLRDRALHMLELAPGKAVLDIGCANGATMVYCGLQGATVHGCDLDERAVGFANNELARFDIRGEAIVGDATKLTAYADDTFDAVISSDFVEHITDEQKVAMLLEAKRVLKPGGLLVIKTPNLAYLEASLFYKRIRAVRRFENPMKFVIPHTPGTDDPQHIGLATRWSFTNCLIKAGFLNYEFHYAPLRRFGTSGLVEILSTEIPVVRDWLCEDLFCKAYKPIVASHFPD
ncbi:MAG: class I SAM-dependent methyltransferase [Labilithrix sp.]|nr:class I SAM-dependent methyltransferase [Labilithrix sp.]